MRSYNPFDYPPHLVRATQAVNQAIREIYGYPGGCILGSYALYDLLQRLHVKSKIVRIEAYIFPNKGNRCEALGSAGDGTRRPKAEKGMWNGHLGVLVDDRWLLDPTLDQVNERGIAFAEPMVVEMHATDSRGRPCSWNEYRNQTVRFHIYHRQAGFKSAPDARPSHWKPVAQIAWRIFNEESHAA